jgi:malate synthase
VNTGRHDYIVDYIRPGNNCHPDVGTL